MRNHIFVLLFSIAAAFSCGGGGGGGGGSGLDPLLVGTWTVQNMFENETVINADFSGRSSISFPFLGSCSGTFQLSGDRSKVTYHMIQKPACGGCMNDGDTTFEYTVSQSSLSLKPTGSCGTADTYTRVNR